MYFETHAHYDFKNFNKDREELLGSSLPAAGVKYIINIGIDMPSSVGNIELSKKYDYVYAAIGFHPIDSYLMQDGDAEKLKELAKFPKVVAIGEIGLDFYHKTTPKDVQIKRFKELLQLAKEVQKPVIIHSRQADDEVYEILAESGVGQVCGGVLHCFSGVPELAQKYIEMGFHIGVGGIVTYKNADELVETVSKVPLDRLLIETDCPFLSPEPNRGKRNDSKNLYYIVEKIAQIRQITHDEVALATLNNAKKLFRI